MAKRLFPQDNNLKETILAAAKEIILQKGHSALNIREIARKSGCSTGSIYNAFKNIDILLLYLNGNTLDLLLDFLKKGYINAKRTKHVGRSMGKLYIRFTQEHNALWKLLFAYQHKEPKEIPFWYQEKVDELFQFIQETLSQDMQGEPSEIARLSHTLWASLHGICVLELSGKLVSTKSDTPEKLWDTLYTHLLNSFNVDK